MVGPNIAGFMEAQSRLRNLLGSSATFRVPVGATYPPGTPVDPQSGRPYDPTIQPTTPASTIDKVHKVGVVLRQPSGRGGTIAVSWSGLRRSDTVILELDEAVALDVEDATTVSIKGLDFKIAEVRSDPGLDNRYLATVELM